MPIFAWALIRKEKQAFGWKGKKKNFSPLRIFIFRSLIHFEFIFVNGVRKCSNLKNVDNSQIILKKKKNEMALQCLRGLSRRVKCLFKEPGK